jgi:hypothetical protein
MDESPGNIGPADLAVARAVLNPENRRANRPPLAARDG